MNTLEFYQQTYTYDIGNNLTALSHQANSNTWQQTLAIHPNNNRGTETQQSTSDFDANGNLLTLNNIGTLDWHYNNTLNQLTKANKINIIEYYVYDYQGNRARTVVESDHQAQSKRDYLPSLDISINQAKQQSTTLHIGTHILSETTESNTQTHYQLTSHLQSNTLELDDKAQTLSYEHYYPYGGTAIIASKDKTQAQQKRYRYTGKERDDSNGLCYYGARYLAPWLARWISPDSAGVVDGLNLYAYVSNNPLKYRDLTGHVKTIAGQKNIEEGAVSRMNNVLAELLNLKKYTKTKEEASLDLKIEKTKVMQQAILQLDIFKKLGALQSSSRFIDAGACNNEVEEKIGELRNDVEKYIPSRTIFNIRAIIQFNLSDKYKDLVLNKHKVANCAECSTIMLGELSKKYLDMTVELISNPQANHAFNLINRDQSTSIFKPEEWNEDVLVVDAWMRTVHTKKEFIFENFRLNYYSLDVNTNNEIHHTTKYADHGMNYRIFKEFDVTSEVTML
ncbi:hypothetical protein BSPWISOXPB_2342 [uncultured Gammaproteobacteria bacterium]|nr:hypothetical protein BSPWISOXPB_2342 [uncultured Gammaproteobacteria bacterium]